MLSFTGLHKQFRGVAVLSGVDLTIGQGEVVGLIGRSGVGKSTLARLLVGLEVPEAGTIRLAGHEIVPGKGSARRRIQYLWQDPMQALSPYLSALGAVLETLHGYGIGQPHARPARARALLGSLGIDTAMAARKPHALSGGQCQRVALARALAAEPDLLILDEPFSALDVTAQLAATALLERVHAERGLSMLIVSHDLAPLRRLAHRIAVLDGGRIVEDLPVSVFMAEARHPLSRAYVATMEG
ncbi:ATP-binding cassette domain-containing protein [Phaeovulum sp.]|uniref:ATP-binding cassette domain-containing protein n=1 Tax=Phaeovulum sp. TaxID=2934796 RepID=UPI0035624386